MMTEHYITKEFVNKVVQTDLETDCLQSLHNAWIQFIHNLSQLFLPELIGKLLANCDAVVIGGLGSIVDGLEVSLIFNPCEKHCWVSFRSK